MWIRWLLIVQLAAMLMACASPKVHWRDISRHLVQQVQPAQSGQTQLALCEQLYQDVAQVGVCQVEMSALIRARKQCTADSNPAYCVRMAEYTWRHYKDHVLMVEPELSHAKAYPVMCGYQEKQIAPCREQP
ncbi:hypothetical protein KDD30_08005 [Photobacterium sp. GJ3]|uniref:hypothetical protein n=1 Tax=Photobacterium sp. GJ3 TaxID=2829502 RepID=UPI001B8D19EA|nr:hypothetical protein [Photobacterium sp. GJ3]QUJ68993.1 hypothetical protein KDD30_08005 [Photobacterium sp. GJ3]